MYKIKHQQTRVTAKLTSKNQLTLPKTVRDVLQIQAADMIIFSIDEQGTVTLKRAQNDLWTTLNEQAAKYGNPNTPEMTWGPDIEAGDFD